MERKEVIAAFPESRGKRPSPGCVQSLNPGRRGAGGGREQGNNVLPEMNSLVDDHEEFVKSLALAVDVLS